MMKVLYLDLAERRNVLTKLCRKKIGEKSLSCDEYETRLKYELHVIKELKYESVFLICYKIIKWARSEGIRVGVGRGSAASSLVCYLLDITKLDPLKYKLKFERFLVEGRVSPPDIDMDFEKGRHEEVYEYLEQLLGADKVIRLCTFHFMRMKSAFRDVGRVLEIPLTDIETILKSIPWERKDDSIQKMAKSPELNYWSNKYPALFRLAATLQNVPRHVGVHPAGIIISKHPVRNIMPLQWIASGKIVATQWDMHDYEMMGVVKLDLLRLDTLDIAKEILESIKTQGEEVPDIDTLVPTNKKVLDEFAKGNTVGIFQFERRSVQTALRQTSVSDFKDLVAMNALLRPGATAANSPEEYANRKRGRAYTVNSYLRPILKETFGLLVYQEQAMEIVNKIADFSAMETDDFRRSIAKLHTKAVIKFEQKFRTGALKKGLNKSEIAEIWLLLKGAGAYMFNKAHSSCYAYIAYQMMFLKTYYPTEFWAATLNSKINDTSKLDLYIRHLIGRGYEILSVTVKDSQASFSPVTKSIIRAGFKRIKGIGETAAIELSKLKERDTMQEWVKSLTDIETNRKVLNSRIIKVLDEAGAFNCYNLSKEQKEEMINEITKKAASKRKPRLEEIYLFGDEPEKVAYQTIEDYKKERSEEKETEQI